MEEKEKEVKKLSYEQLEGAAKQLSAQLDAIVKENQQLKAFAQKLQLDNLFAELNFRFKVLEHAEAFPEEFIDKIVGEIQDIMTPKAAEEEEKE